jgi:hypothetical protein
MQLKEKKSNMERDKRKMECELEKQRQNIGKQVFLQVVQKSKPTKDESSSLLTPAQNKPVETELQGSRGLLSPLTLQTSNGYSNQPPTFSTSRRQWDKSQMKNFDLEQQNHVSNESKKLLSTQNAKHNSSMSTTPNSSASQSPPSANTNKSASEQQPNGDLTKANYSRDDMSKAIELLKEKFVQESLNVAQAAEQIKKSQSSSQSQNSRLSSNQPAMSNNTAMVKDIEVLNSKLADLQNEINRLTLLQQKQYSQQHINAQKLLSSATTTTTTNAKETSNNQAESNGNQDEEEVANDDEAANGNFN